MGLFMCSRVNFMCSRGHLCVPELIHVFQSSCLCSRVHLCVPEFTYVFQSSFMCFQVHLCVPELIYKFQTLECLSVFQTVLMCSIFLFYPVQRENVDPSHLLESVQET